MIPITMLPRRFPTASKRSLSIRSLVSRTLPRSFGAAPGLLPFRKEYRPYSPSFPSSERSFTTLRKPVADSTALSSAADDEETTIITNHDLYGRRPGTWWTGVAPSDGCPGLWEDGAMSSLALPNLATCTRQQVMDYFDNTWTLTEVLFASLQGKDAFTIPPYHDLRHPMIFYYGHPAVLYINKMRLAGLIAEPINPYFESIFETGVDEMRWDDMSKNQLDWPTVGEVHEYRRKVYETVKSVIASHPDLEAGHKPITQQHPLWSIFMGFEHERIHLETSSVLLRELPVSYLRKPEFWPGLHSSAYEQRAAKVPVEGVDFPVNRWVAVNEGEATIGKPKDFPSYGWDNEYGSKRMTVKPFAATSYKITNGEFYDFVVSKAYHDPKYWSEEGWKWRTFRNIKKPTFWVQDGPAGLNQFRLRTIFEEIEMPWDWPVDVNYHEAKAFAAFKAEKDGRTTPYRIMTEAEHHRIRDDYHDDPVMSTKGRMTEDKAMNLNLSLGSETPVNLFPASHAGFHDVFGNVWEWCEDHFSALPGFEIHPFYDDFSSPCFDGEHHIILGGSFISTGDNGGSIYCRYHFRPHFFQHAGFRLVDAQDPNNIITTTCMDGLGPYVKGSPCCHSDKANEERSNMSERDAIEKNVLIHYAQQGEGQEQIMPFSFPISSATNFPQRCAAYLVDCMAKYGQTGGMGKVIDVGCGAGAVSFELARSFNHVDGLDISATMIETAKRVQKEGMISMSIMSEGALSLPFLGLVDGSINRSKVHFKQADAQCIPPSMGGYDAAVVSNLLEFLSSPSGPLSRMGGPKGLVKAGGLVMVLSSYEWTEKRTPRASWLGGYQDDRGQAVSSIDGIRAALGPEFELVERADMPVLQRENGRAFRVTVPEASVWRRKA